MQLNYHNLFIARYNCVGMEKKFRESHTRIISSIDVQDRSRSLYKRKEYAKLRTITFTNHEREEHRIFIKPGQKWRWPFVKGVLDLGFQPTTTACRLSSARNCLFAVKVSSLFFSLSLSLFLPFTLGRLHLRPSPSPFVLAFFSRGSFPVPAKAQRIHEKASLCLLQPERTFLETLDVMARLACLEHERGSHT